MITPQRVLPVLLLFAVLSAGCTAPAVREVAPDGADEGGVSDPFEPFNRAMFAFNEKFDAWLLKPAARGYDFALPRVAKQGIGNFFSNLLQPRVAVNDLLQGKFAQSARDTGRFLINSTVGVVGLIDVAKSVGLEPKEEDWGQTFAVWGAGAGPYFVWPIIGSRTLRDTFGFGFDWLSTPVTYIRDPYTEWGAWALDIVDTRTRLLPAEKVLEQAVGEDKYAFMREAYHQRRRNLIYDGNPPKPKFFEEDLEETSDTAPPAEGTK